MDTSLNSYVVQKVGTINGDFELKSRFIMLEVNEEAPIDTTLWIQRIPNKTIQNYKSPHLIYKTKYDKAGEVLFNPPFGTARGDNVTRSSGDNPRRVYLGVSNTVGIDRFWHSYKVMTIT